MVSIDDVQPGLLFGCLTRWKFLLLLFYVLVTGLALCTADPHSYILENITIVPNKSNISGSVGPGLLNVYTLDARSCADENSFLVVALESNPMDIFTSYDYDHVSYVLWMNIDGHNPLFDTDNDTLSATTNIRSPSLDSCSPFTQVQPKVTCRQSYAFLKLQLTEALREAMPWYVGVSSSGILLNYTLKAWCLDNTTGSQLIKPCASVGTAGCNDIRESFVCTAEPVHLTAEQSRVEVTGLSLQSGEWKYYTFNVSDDGVRVLVEMSRLHGDVILFLMPGDSEHKQQALPSEFDVDKYADKLGYENRQNYHHYYFTGVGLFIIGIYNNDACVEEVSLVNLTISTATAHSSKYLCPRDCSYPNGQCVSDLVCQCQTSYGGHFCEGSLDSPHLTDNVSGVLFPGQVAYFKMSDPKSRNQHNWSVKFSQNAVLLAQNGGFPTLANYSLAVGGNVSGEFLVEYEADAGQLAEKDLIIAIVNLDYIVHQISFYNVVINFPGRKGLSTGIILLLAIGSSLVLCMTVALLKRILYQQTNSEFDPVSFGNSENPVVSEGGLQRPAIEMFPIVLYEDSCLSNDQAQCPICLVDYETGEVLRKIHPCYHAFHKDCVDQWLICHGNCPLCRISL